MTTKKQYELQSGLLGRLRKLILTPDFLEFENKDLKGNEFTRLNKSDIIDFKHGIESIVWYRFIVGQKFVITFKDKKNKELKISFKNYFGLRSNYEQIYSDIVDDIWKFYQEDIVDHHLDKFNRNEELQLKGVIINKKGVGFANGGETIKWAELSVKDYYEYFAIYNTHNPDVHLRISFNEYESEILWSIIRTIPNEMHGH